MLFSLNIFVKTKIMNDEKLNETADIAELPDDWWYRVYLGVIITNILVIAALGTFTRYFST